MYNIVVIGVGALGKRHLSSILNSELPLNVFCFDVNQNALASYEWEDRYDNKTLKMISSFNELPDKTDFALFAMTANGRREVFDELIKHTRVNNILFEKFLFQREEDYAHVGQKLNELNINAWVNCARRQMDSYQQLKDELLKAREMYITISGGEWGLACNAIHELDLISFLTQDKDLVIDSLDLIPGLFDSKRPGYKEVYGTIYGSCGKCKRYIINCMKDTNVPDFVSIATDVGQYYIVEGKRKLITMRKNDEYELQEEDFNIPYQSQMTQLVMEDVLLRGESRLATYGESAELHIKFLMPLIEYFNKNGMEGDLCPIT